MPQGQRSNQQPWVVEQNVKTVEASRHDTKTDEEQNHADVTKIEVRLSNTAETNAVPGKRSDDTEGPKGRPS